MDKTEISNFIFEANASLEMSLQSSTPRDISAYAIRSLAASNIVIAESMVQMNKNLANIDAKLSMLVKL